MSPRNAGDDRVGDRDWSACKVARGDELTIAISRLGVESQEAFLGLAEQGVSFVGEAAAASACRESREAVTNLRSSL